jgi:predicted transcriptional regulator of viral defense system
LDDVREIYGLDGTALRSSVHRLKERGYTELLENGKYRKLVKRIM